MGVRVIHFVGHTCYHDTVRPFGERGHAGKLVWHKDRDLQSPDLVVLPRGFSYGDYLRCGSLARFSPIVNEVVAFAESGGLVLGICNGFQILTECDLLPGSLLMNSGLTFICQHQYIRVESANTPFTRNIPVGRVLDLSLIHI